MIRHVFQRLIIWNCLLKPTLLVAAALIPIHYTLAIEIDISASRRSLNMLCKIIFLNDMRKNENGNSFVNRCIRLGGSVVVTSTTGNKFDIAQFPRQIATTTIANKRR
jgi:hypothetical protein